MNTLQATRIARKLKLKKRGIVYPVRTVREAANAGLPLYLACAFLEQESAGGHNVFGHDNVSNPIKGGAVTRSRYLEYKRYRLQGLGMQGVGPMQLTWFSYQDQADRLGGCWRPAINMRVGFRRAAQLIHINGEYAGIKAYNGTGPAADSYASSVLAKARKWKAIL